MKNITHQRELLKNSIIFLLFSTLILGNLNSQVINTCGTTFYDSGGATGNYGSSEDYSVTYCSDNGGNIRALFKEFSLNLQAPSDILYVYDGASTFSPLIGGYTGATGITGEEFTAHSLIRASGNCLTFEFNSFGLGTSAGWEADIYCLDPPQGGTEICGDGIDNDADGLIDSADPDCPFSISVEDCRIGFSYLLPPLWQIYAADAVDSADYIEPASLFFSTIFPEANFNVSTINGAYNQDFSITNGSPLTQVIPIEFMQTRLYNTIERNKGFIITSDVPLEIKYLLEGDLNRNLITIKDQESLGKGFRVGSQTNTIVASEQTRDLRENHFISVMATEDNTRVTFKFDVPMAGISSPHSILLDRGETYLIKDDDNNVTVSGALVSADKDISVFSGSQHTSAYGVTEKDGGVDHLVPASQAGNDYVVLRGSGADEQDYAIVVPLENGTSIYVNGSVSPAATINAGDFYNVDITGSHGEPSYIRTSKPSLVYHVAGESAGDVGMAIVPPVGSCRGDNFAQFSKFAGSGEYTLFIVIPNTGLATLEINGSVYMGVSTAVPGFAGFSSVLLQDGNLADDNEITSDVNFSAGLLISEPGNSGTYGYITSFEERIDILDPNTGIPSISYVLDTLCSGASVNHSLTVESCGTTHKIISIESAGIVGTSAILDSNTLEITYNSFGTITGEDVISIVVENDLGIQTAVCVGVFISDLDLNLGSDRSTCLEMDFTLSPLSVTGGLPPYTYLWSTGATTESIMVNPGVTSLFGLTVTDASGCTSSDDLNVFLGAPPQLVCNDHINISLNDMCELEVMADILLEGENEIEDFYQVEVKDRFGFIIPDAIINAGYIGETLNFSVTTICGNNCWGTLYVEDKLRPIIICGNYEVLCTEDVSPDSIGFPMPVVDPVEIAEFTYVVNGVDACGDVTLSYVDYVENFECEDEYEKIIYRNWSVFDNSGNSGTCQDTINVIRETLDNIELPLNRDDNELPSLACDGKWDRFENGYPSTDISAGGGPNIGSCQFIQATFEDSYFDLCGGSFKILRHWIIFDWCDGSNIDHYQIIKITDKVAPVVVCPAPLTISTDFDDCNSGLALIQAPDAKDNCSETSYTVEIITDPENLLSHPIDLNGIASDLPLGENLLIYRVSDDCGNTTTCETTITVADDKLPFPVADQHTVVSIGTDGTARVFAETFDDGSFDNCGIKLMKVRKETDECGTDQGDYFFQGSYYNDYVDFCCSEIGTTVKAQFLVEDIHGNINQVWVEVTLNDKLFPTITCPTDLTISCTTPIDLVDLSNFGRMAQDDETRNPIIIDDFYNTGTVGIDGYARDNCDVSVTESIDADLDCGYGDIRRIFTAKDNNGMTASCVQRILVRNPDPFDYDDIVWPKHKTVSSCANVDLDPSNTGKPDYLNENCATIVASYKDKVFTIVDSACVLIHREWLVLDWCQYVPITETGLWKYNQIIKVENNVGPEFDGEFSYQDTTVCIYGSCEGLVELGVHATDDCTPDVVYNWQIDFDLDGFFDDEGTGNTLSEIWEPGRYFLVWTAEDLCGNLSTVRYYVTVEDCKAPTPYCLSDLATVVMPSAGMITIWASDFDFGSFDNCTAQEDLKLSFSTDTTDTNVIFTCDMIENGIQQSFLVQLWVTDEKGNQDFCNVVANIQDNGDACEDTGEAGSVLISGIINAHNNNDPIKDVNVILETNTSELGQSILTAYNGLYDFETPMFVDYRLEPVKNDRHLEGVSTLDLIQIQKHILGITKIENPYFLIAADINDSGNISASDLIQMRKLILGIYDEYPSNTSWKFVDKKYEFNDIDNPWDFRNYIDIISLNDTYESADFMGIKIGDVNGSYVSQSNSDVKNRNNGLEIITDNKSFVKGDIVSIKIAANENIVIEGLQGDFNFDNKLLQYDRISSKTLNLDDSHVSANEESIGISYDNISSVSLIETVNFLEINFIALGSGTVRSAFSLSEDRISAEVYTPDGVQSLGLGYRNAAHDDFTSTINLYQNEPNPFTNITKVSFDMPKTQKATFQVFDINGKLVMEVNKTFDAGKNTIQISESQLGATGVYYYQLLAENYQASRKMILTK